MSGKIDILSPLSRFLFRLLARPKNWQRVDSSCTAVLLCWVLLVQVFTLSTRLASPFCAFCYMALFLSIQFIFDSKVSAVPFSPMFISVILTVSFRLKSSLSESYHLSCVSVSRLPHYQHFPLPSLLYFPLVLRCLSSPKQHREAETEERICSLPQTAATKRTYN